MHLESLTIKNYRKFRSTDNTICFVKPQFIDIFDKKEGGGLVSESSTTLVVEESNDEEHLKSVIAPSTTLIIGKNNSGKTTVVNALKMLCQNEQPLASDFNISYLNELFYQYKKAFEVDKKTTFERLETPSLEFTLSISVDFNDEDLMTYLSPFISIDTKSNGKPVSVKIIIEIVLCEEVLFKSKVSDILKHPGFDGNPLNSRQQFDLFYRLLEKETQDLTLEGNLYRILFSNLLDNSTEKFSLKKLINIKEIRANRHLKEGVLSDVFNKIVAFQFTNDIHARTGLEKSIGLMNTQISNNVGSKSTDISQVLGQIESSNKVNLSLSGNVTYHAIMKGLIKYNFMDGDDYIPEDQFGLGYINLLNIIGEIIHFVDSYEDKSYLSCINLLFIEEPEAFMHPQMQEFFIKRIDNAVKKALEIANLSSDVRKILQCQIAITTHSSHIVNSKINSSNTFNNINYLTTVHKNTKVVNLTDEVIVPNEDNDDLAVKEKLNFIKKHIKYKVSELFFSDAVIFVEGITEETLLNYYLEKDRTLSNYYISVFNINGAHGQLYLPLVKKLSVPSLIVTDLDIKREKCEKNEKHKDNKTCEICKQQEENDKAPVASVSKVRFAQITDLAGRITTNETIKKLNRQLRKKSESDSNSLLGIEYFEDDNLYVVFQKDPIEGQYATSLEEALILTNYDNGIINRALEKCKRDIYRGVLNESGESSRKNLINNSYKLQKKLSDSKSDFSNDLIFNLLSEEDKSALPQLPNYIIDGMKWLVCKLQPNKTPSQNDGEMFNSMESDDINVQRLESVPDDAE